MRDDTRKTNDLPNYVTVGVLGPHFLNETSKEKHFCEFFAPTCGHQGELWPYEAWLRGAWSHIEVNEKHRTTNYVQNVFRMCLDCIQTVFTVFSASTKPSSWNFPWWNYTCALRSASRGWKRGRYLCDTSNSSWFKHFTNCAEGCSWCTPEQTELTPPRH